MKAFDHRRRHRQIPRTGPRGAVRVADRDVIAERARINATAMFEETLNGNRVKSRIARRPARRRAQLQNALRGVGQFDLVLFEELKRRQRGDVLRHAGEAEQRRRLCHRPVRLGEIVAARINELGAFDDGDRPLPQRLLAHEFLDHGIDVGVLRRAGGGEGPLQRRFALHEHSGELCRGGARARRLHANRDIALTGPGVEFLLILHGGQAVPRRPVVDPVVDKNRGEAAVRIGRNARRPAPARGLRVDARL